MDLRQVEGTGSERLITIKDVTGAADQGYATLAARTARRDSGPCMP